MYIKVYSLCCKVLWLLTNTSYLIFAVTVSYRMISPSGLVVNFSLLDFIPEILLALSLECIYNLRIYCLCCCLVLPSCFSRARLCATPQTAAHRAPPSLGFSRQDHWSGLPFPPPKHESESEVAQSCPTLSDPMDCSLPGPSLHGIFQARALEWGAIGAATMKNNMQVT